MSSVYLAGPIATLHYNEAVSWRYKIQDLLGSDYAHKHITCYSPMRWKDYLKNTEILNSYEESGYVLSTDDAITARDRFDVMRCDLMIVNFIGATAISKGTFIELGWADAFRKPVVCMIEKDVDNVNNHPMLNSIASFFVSSIEECVQVVKAILLP